MDIEEYRKLCHEKSKFLLKKSTFYVNIKWAFNNIGAMDKINMKSIAPMEYYISAALSELTSLGVEVCRSLLKILKIYAERTAIVNRVRIRDIDPVLFSEASITPPEFVRENLPFSSLCTYLRSKEVFYTQLLWTVLCYIRNSNRRCGRRYGRRDIFERIDNTVSSEELDMMLEDPYIRLVHEIGRISR